MFAAEVYKIMCEYIVKVNQSIFAKICTKTAVIFSFLVTFCFELCLIAPTRFVISLLSLSFF